MSLWLYVTEPFRGQRSPRRIKFCLLLLNNFLAKSSPENKSHDFFLFLSRWTWNWFLVWWGSLKNCSEWVHHTVFMPAWLYMCFNLIHTVLVLLIKSFYEFFLLCSFYYYLIQLITLQCYKVYSIFFLYQNFLQVHRNYMNRAGLMASSHDKGFGK